MLPDLERAEQIGEFWSYPQSRSFAELLIAATNGMNARVSIDGGGIGPPATGGGYDHAARRAPPPCVLADRARGIKNQS